MYYLFTAFYIGNTYYNIMEKIIIYYNNLNLLITTNVKVKIFYIGR